MDPRLFVPRITRELPHYARIGAPAIGGIFERAHEKRRDVSERDAYGKPYPKHRSLRFATAEVYPMGAAPALRAHGLIAS